MQFISCNDPKFGELWLQLSQSARYLNSFYQPVNLLFYEELFSSVDTKEISFLVVSNGIPYCIKAHLHTQSDSSCQHLVCLLLYLGTSNRRSYFSGMSSFCSVPSAIILDGFNENLYVHYKDDLVNNSLSPTRLY